MDFDIRSDAVRAYLSTRVISTLINHLGDYTRGEGWSLVTVAEVVALSDDEIWRIHNLGRVAQKSIAGLRRIAKTREVPVALTVKEKAAAYDRINSPELLDFVRAVHNEALHQRERWGIEGDAGKSDADWLWLIGYLAGKALHNPPKDDMAPVAAKLHRIITVAAAAANWHAATMGTFDQMRPGIAAPEGAN
jgi:hypothetical protein